MRRPGTRWRSRGSWRPTARTWSGLPTSSRAATGASPTTRCRPPGRSPGAAGSLRDPERLKPWLVSVAANEARSVPRRRRAAVVEIDGRDPAGRDPADQRRARPGAGDRTICPRTSGRSWPCATRRGSIHGDRATDRTAGRLRLARDWPDGYASGWSSPMPELDPSTPARDAVHAFATALQRAGRLGRGRAARDPERDRRSPRAKPPAITGSPP